MPNVKEECGSCKATGLYRGFSEPAGSAVVCLSCDGAGWRWHSYTEFTGRKHLKGVHKINTSRGSFIGTGVGATGPTMTYAEFEKKYPS